MQNSSLSLLTAGALLLPLVLSPSSPSSEHSAGGVVTLYALDDLRATFDFRGGRLGARVQDGEVRIEGAQLAFDVFEAGRLSLGFVRDELVRIVDLGPTYVESHMRIQDRAEEYPISIFHTLFRDGARFAYLGPGSDRRHLRAADRIWKPLEEGVKHLEPAAGHTYLLRVRQSGVGRQDELFKFQVVGYLPGHSLTLRWAPVPEQ